MLSCFSTLNKKTIPLFIVTEKDFRQWISTQKKETNIILQQQKFTGKPGECASLLTAWIACVSNENDIFSIGDLAYRLPIANYRITPLIHQPNFQDIVNYAIGFGCGAYHFSRYRKNKKISATLALTQKEYDAVSPIVESIYQVRDLINTPANDMGPAELATQTQKLAKSFSATCKVITGKNLLKENYPAIYAVGKASPREPRLIDLRWGNRKNPKLTLVGKGVCFDTGGLNIKPDNGMALMKKDMGGAAHVLGLAKLIMQTSLPVYLRVLIPAVDNAISGDAFRPGDIIDTREGTQVEIGNTDAEGRLILADALHEGARENPDLLIDFATLTGAARIALGTEIPVFFTPNHTLAQAIETAGNEIQETLWRLPLHEPYRSLLDSPFADCNNISSNSYGGAIIAALFLKIFTKDFHNWLHFDIMAWNIRSRPGRPIGGEAMGLRAIWHYLQKRYPQK